MSRKIALIGAILIVLLVVAALVAPFVVGFKVENTFRNNVAEIADKAQQSAAFDGSIKLVNYDRGWFSSAATTRIVDRGHTIVLHHDIRHGPYAVFGWAQIHSTPAFGPKVARIVDQYFDGAPLVADTTIGFSGDVDVRLHSPPLVRQIDMPNGPKLIWKGFKAHYSESEHHGQLTASAPRLDARSKGFRLSFRQMHVKASGFDNDAILAHPLEPKVWRSNLDLGFDHFNVVNDQSGKTFRATGKLSFKSRTDMQKKHHVYLVNDLELDDARIELPAKQGQNIAYRIKHGKLEYSISGINARPLVAMIRQIRSYYRQAGSDADREALTRKMAIRIGVPRLSMPAGNAKGWIVMQLTPAAQGSVKTSLTSLLRRLSLTVNAGADAKLVRAWMRPYYPPLMIRQRLAILTARNFLTKKDDRYHFKLTYNNGQLNINGRSANPLLQRLLRRAL